MNKAKDSSFTFKAQENGTYNITLSGDIQDDNTLEWISNIRKETSVNVTGVQPPKTENNQTPVNNTPTTPSDNGNSSTVTTTSPINSGTTPSNLGEKSSNSKLRSLIISPVDFTGFKPDKYTGYSVIVDNTITEVKVDAVPQDAKAIVKIAGYKDLEVGNNTVNITVVAQDGSTTIYKVMVNRMDVNGNQTDVVVDNNIDIFLNELSIEGVELTPSFQKDVFEYQGTLTQDIEKVNLLAKANDDSVEISILGNENLTRGKNNITILLNSSKSVETKIYKIVLKKEVIDQELINIEQQNNVNKQEKNKMIVKIVLGIMVVIGVVLVIIKIRMIIKKREPLPIDFAFSDEEDNKKDEYKSEEIDPRTKKLFEGKMNKK